MTNHAFLSASASERWIRCPPSARLCAGEEDPGSEYAREGSDAHRLAQYLLEKALGREAQDPTENLTYYDQEMRECAESYAAFIMEQVAEAKTLCHDPLVCVEQRVDFSRWVPEGFGTADALIVADEWLFVSDFKFGAGRLVYAEGEEGTGNPQIKCYALGALDTFGDLYEITRVRLAIYQPRRENVSTFEMTKEELLRWAEEELAPRAQLAWEGGGEFEVGSHCQFCLVKSTCRKRAEYAMELMKYDFAEAPTLDNNEIADILKRIDALTGWTEDIKNYALAQALSGIRYPGFKLVAGKSNRKFTDEAAVAKAVSEAGFDPYEKKVVGITEMTKRLGRKLFEDLLKGWVIKPPAKPALVLASDERPEISLAENDFEKEQ